MPVRVSRAASTAVIAVVSLVAVPPAASLAQSAAKSIPTPASILAAVGTLIAALLFGRFLFFRPGPFPAASRR